jgi:hypothetical protein
MRPRCAAADPNRTVASSEDRKVFTLQTIFDENLKAFNIDSWI